MSIIFTEGSSIENSVEQKDLHEYIIPFTPEDGELVHNLTVLENISNLEATLGENILDGVRIGSESYSIKPTEVYTINNDGKKVFITGKPGSANRMAFYAYPDSPQETLDGIDASPYLKVHKVELIMTRKTVNGDIKFVHSYPQVNVDILFVNQGYGNIPSTYFLYPTGRADTIGLEESNLRFIKYGDHPVVAVGRRNREKFFDGRMTYEKLLRSIQESSGFYGGLQPKEVYLQLALTEDKEYESNLVISI